jgi:predicted HNH restriction endonuclease
MAALEFHHLDPSIKESKIIGSTASLEKQRAEVKKCILVCANCHREIHHSGD